jgi:hypothetical protein
MGDSSDENETRTYMAKEVKISLALKKAKHDHELSDCFKLLDAKLKELSDKSAPICDALGSPKGNLELE